MADARYAFVSLRELIDAKLAQRAEWVRAIAAIDVELAEGLTLLALLPTRPPALTRTATQPALKGYLTIAKLLAVLADGGKTCEELRTLLYGGPLNGPRQLNFNKWVKAGKIHNAGGRWYARGVVYADVTHGASRGGRAGAGSDLARTVVSAERVRGVEHGVST